MFSLAHKLTCLLFSLFPSRFRNWGHLLKYRNCPQIPCMTCNQSPNPKQKNKNKKKAKTRIRKRKSFIFFIIIILAAMIWEIGNPQKVSSVFPFPP